MQNSSRSSFAEIQIKFKVGFLKGYTPKWEVKKTPIGDLRHSDSYSEEYRAYFYSRSKNRAYYALVKFVKTPGTTTGKFWLVAKTPDIPKRKWKSENIITRTYSDVDSKNRILRNVEETIRARSQSSEIETISEKQYRLWESAHTVSKVEPKKFAISVIHKDIFGHQVREWFCAPINGLSSKRNASRYESRSHALDVASRVAYWFEDAKVDVVRIDNPKSR